MPQPIDYDALAKASGAIGSTPASSGVDYDALAKQSGAIGSTPASSPSATGHAPGLMDDVRDSVNFLGDELHGFRTAIPNMAKGIWNGTEKFNHDHPVLSAIPGASVIAPMVKSAWDATEKPASEAAKDLKNGDYGSAVPHLLGSVPLLSPVSDAYDQYQSGDMKGLANNIGNTAGQVVAGKLGSEAASRVPEAVQAVQDAQLPGRMKAFSAKPSNLQNFSDSFSAVPTQKPVIGQALDTLKRDGINPESNLPDMQASIKGKISDLSDTYKKVIPQVQNRLTSADDLVADLQKQKSAYMRGNVVSDANKGYVAKIDQEINSVRELAEQRGNGKLDFDDVRYLRDGMNGRTDFTSPQADEDLYRNVGNVYRGTLDKMAPETTQLNRDFANYKNLEFVADKNMAMGRGITESGLSKIFKPKTALGALGAAAGSAVGGVPGFLLGAVAPEAMNMAFKLAKTLPERVGAFRNFQPPVEAPTPLFTPKGLLGPASIITPQPVDASGPVPGEPYMGRGMSPDIGTRRLSASSVRVTPQPVDPSGSVPFEQQRNPGFWNNFPKAKQLGPASSAPPFRNNIGSKYGDPTSEELVPFKHPITGKTEYIPKWMLQKMIK